MTTFLDDAADCIYLGRCIGDAHLVLVDWLPFIYYSWATFVDAFLTASPWNSCMGNATWIAAWPFVERCSYVLHGTLADTTLDVRTPTAGQLLNYGAYGTAAAPGILAAHTCGLLPPPLHRLCSALRLKAAVCANNAFAPVRHARNTAGWAALVHVPLGLMYDQSLSVAISLKTARRPPLPCRFPLQVAATAALAAIATAVASGRAAAGGA